MVSTPLVYHDADKELLLTFFPPELGLPLNEQERMIGPMINQVMNKLPQEKRKAYLLRPQTMLSMQHMLERILEGDGVTKEMIQDQQKRIDVIRQLMLATVDTRETIIDQNKDLFDEPFFAIFSRLLEGAMMSQDQNTAKQLSEVQKLLLEKTSFGQEIMKQNSEAEAAVKSLQEASKDGLTREKLVDLIVAAPSEIQVATIVRLARNGLDYSFFQILSTKIDAATGDEKTRLTALRESLLKMTAELDLEMQEQAAKIKELIDKVIEAPDIEKTVEQILPAVNEVFVDVLRKEITDARASSNLERSAKLQKIVDVIQKASAPPPEYAFIEKLLAAENEEAITKLLDESSAMLTPEMLQLVSGLIAQAEEQKEEPEVVERLKLINRLALRKSMQANLAK